MKTNNYKCTKLHSPDSLLGTPVEGLADEYLSSANHIAETQFQLEESQQ